MHKDRMGWTTTEHRKYHLARSAGGRREPKELNLENKVKAGWEKPWQGEWRAGSKYLQSKGIEGE